MPKVHCKYYQRAKDDTISIISFLESAYRFPYQEPSTSTSTSNKETIINTSSTAVYLLSETYLEQFTEKLNINTALVDCDYNDDLTNDFYLNESNSDNNMNDNNIINNDNSSDQIKSTDISDLDTSVHEDATKYIESFTSKLATWVLKNKISHFAINELLNILKPKYPELPIDARVLLKSLRDKKILKVVPPGYYYHFGL